MTTNYNHNVMPLVAELAEAKSAEDAAVARRITIEQQILDVLGTPEEGSKTHHVGPHKVTVTQRIDRKLNADQWEDGLYGRVPAGFQPVKERREYTIDAAELRRLQANNPHVWREISAAITAKPAKPNIKVSLMPLAQRREQGVYPPLRWGADANGMLKAF